MTCGRRINSESSPPPRLLAPSASSRPGPWSARPGPCAPPSPARKTGETDGTGEAPSERGPRRPRVGRVDGTPCARRRSSAAADRRATEVTQCVGRHSSWRCDERTRCWFEAPLVAPPFSMPGHRKLGAALKTFLDDGNGSCVVTTCQDEFMRTGPCR